jgi:hypothetical protein
MKLFDDCKTDGEVINKFETLYDKSVCVVLYDNPLLNRPKSDSIVLLLSYGHYNVIKAYEAFITKIRWSTHHNYKYCYEH